MRVTNVLVPQFPFFLPLLFSFWCMFFIWYLDVSALFRSCCWCSFFSAERLLRQQRTFRGLRGMWCNTQLPPSLFISLPLSVCLSLLLCFTHRLTLFYHVSPIFQGSFLSCSTSYSNQRLKQEKSCHCSWGSCWQFMLCLKIHWSYWETAYKYIL